ncbi:MAG: hypothetical protein KA175_03610 [Flavobacteriales bacterium]|nr:hypothetical protein [Flavobacteriales bacterium]MBP6696680.1 hypothetical protein [Flavobacteriales bacterium]
MLRSRIHACWAVPVLVLMAWQLGFLASFEWQRRAVKQEIKMRLKAGVPQDERTSFQVTEAQYAALDWVKPEREFRSNGRFYDVVELRTQADGTLLLSCIDDRQETELFVQLSDLVELAMGTRGQGRQQTAPMFALWKAVHDVLPLSIVPIRSSIVSHHPDPGAILLTGIRVVPSPPPKA